MVMKPDDPTQDDTGPASRRKGRRYEALSVGQLSARSGVPISTLHFYEAQGLLEGWRTPSNHRRYFRASLRRLALIRVAQRAGVPLREIRAQLSTLPHDEVASAEDWERLAENWRAGLTERIERLTRLRDHMEGCIGCGCLSVSRCPLRNPDDSLAADGPGARLLDPEGEAAEG
ncbi:redox-sensitive transcriptional activator SoxR [Albimonas sp. CAU 1670]|uniref:redox-sensitive transcriptional activator SoxR n=1 Tax=Albimonas sp. CAU 1670 TaxID=3032599 RepID=UPI0023DC2DB9|nr:redox-sensitive transcriptional activator SoxR [Albimonas sp. CAU 1670]MDF2232002.1 redox-sensitive transcriptional activator SoxR [Albimonas sp. CAU 1670]